MTARIAIDRARPLCDVGRTRVWRASLLCCLLIACAACARGSTLASAIGDDEFRALVDGLSEPPGAFLVSDNLVSNEPHVAENARWVRRAGGVYVGVGPEQNFTYIAALRPRLAFIVDIRRENRNLHLLYKALFELSKDRAEFVSRLFSRPRPDGLASQSSVDEIFHIYANVPPSRALYADTAARVREQLAARRHFPLSEADVAFIDHVLTSFLEDGPEIHFWGSRRVDANRPSYRELMTSKDLSGQSRSFLTSEDGFGFVKDLQSRNLIVPVVGDFGGPTAIRRVGDYVRDHRSRVEAFYGSNVAVYLTERQSRAFCRNLASLPAAADAVFIESIGVRSLAAKVKACAPGKP